MSTNIQPGGKTATMNISVPIELYELVMKEAHKKRMTRSAYIAACIMDIHRKDPSP